MKFLLTILSFVSAAAAASAALFVTNTPDAEAFVRSNAPTPSTSTGSVPSISTFE